MHRMRLSLIALALMAPAACAPLSELDERESVMLSRVDSLELQLSECRTQSAMFLDRISAIERENLQLDDQNRLLAARLSELQFPDGSAKVGFGEVSAQPSMTEADKSSEGSFSVREEVRPGSSTATTAGSAPHRSFNPSAAPDVEYLRKYQEALRQHQSGRHDLAYMSFESLLNAPPNDMADNCLYWMGESELKSARHEAAAELFSSVLLCTPSDKVAAALLGRARARIALGHADKARGDLELLRSTHSSAPEAAQAAELLKTLR